MREKETVNHPAHYGGDVKYEPIKLIDDWLLGFSAGNALKYIIRAPHKSSEHEDLKKAAWYLKRAIIVGEQRRMAPPTLFGVFSRVLRYRWITAALDYRMPRHFQLAVAEAAAYHKLNTRLTAAVHAIYELRFPEALEMVTDEIMLAGFGEPPKDPPAGWHYEAGPIGDHLVPDEEPDTARARIQRRVGLALGMPGAARIRIVDTLPELDDLPAKQRYKDMLVGVLENESVYQLGSDLVLWKRRENMSYQAGLLDT